jgi:hypothetical protein
MELLSHQEVILCGQSVINWHRGLVHYQAFHAAGQMQEVCKIL